MSELDIITLDNNKDYVIAKILNHKNKEYYLLIAVDKDENLLDERLILEKVIVDGDESLATIQDELTYKIVSEKFAKLLLESIK